MQRDDATSDDATPECNADIHVGSIPSGGRFPQDVKSPTLHEQQADHNGKTVGHGHTNTVNVGGWKSAGELCHHEINRVALPGDVDYVGFWTG